MKDKIFKWNQQLGKYLSEDSDFFGLQFHNPMNFEHPFDAEKIIPTGWIVKISSINGEYTDSINLTIRVTDVAEPPLILKPAEGSYYVRENTRYVLPFFARLQGNGAPTYSLAGEHASLFKLEPEKGRIILWRPLIMRNSKR